VIDDRYSILGTDINWFRAGGLRLGLPGGQGHYLWQMLARGNKEKLSDAEVEKVVEYGRKYFAPYGEDKVKQFEAHVRYNLRARYDTTMVFYYNRSSYENADEFQTFMDEWCRDDYRAHGKTNGIGESASCRASRISTTRCTGTARASTSATTGACTGQLVLRLQLQPHHDQRLRA